MKGKRGMQLSPLSALCSANSIVLSSQCPYIMCRIGLQSFLCRQYCRMGTFLCDFPKQTLLGILCMEIDLMAALFVAAHFINSYTIPPILFSFSISNGSLCLIRYLSFVLQNLQRSNGSLCLLKMHRLVLKNFSVKRV